MNTLIFLFSILYPAILILLGWTAIRWLTLRFTDYSPVNLRKVYRIGVGVIIGIAVIQLVIGLTTTHQPNFSPDVKPYVMKPVEEQPIKGTVTVREDVAKSVEDKARAITEGIKPSPEGIKPSN